MQKLVKIGDDAVVEQGDALFLIKARVRVLVGYGAKV